MTLKKKLPDVFQNNIGNINNNQKVFCSDSNEVVEKKAHLESNSNKNINQKIVDIFRQGKAVYKIKVHITTNDGITTKYLIGRTDGAVISMDSEVIKISDIIDIKLAE